MGDTSPIGNSGTPVTAGIQSSGLGGATGGGLGGGTPTSGPTGGGAGAGVGGGLGGGPTGGASVGGAPGGGLGGGTQGPGLNGDELNPDAPGGGQTTDAGKPDPGLALAIGEAGERWDWVVFADAGSLTAPGETAVDPMGASGFQAQLARSAPLTPAIDPAFLAALSRVAPAA